jgi:hypothetical protein
MQIILRPNAKGSVDANPGGGYSDNWVDTNYNDINEVSANDSTFFGCQGYNGVTANGEKSFRFPTTNFAGVVDSVVITFRTNAPTLHGWAAPCIYHNGTRYIGTAVAGSGYTTYTQTYTTNPATGVAWTLSDINALDAGIFVNAATLYHSDCSWYYVTVNVNTPPNTPFVPSGTATMLPGILSGEYSTSATDPEGDQVRYWINWNDGTADTVTGLVNSGVTSHLHHTWATAGVYHISAMAEDSRGSQSGWSSSFTVTVNTTPGTPSTPTGTIAGVPGVSYNYTTVATDADGQNLKYTWDWDDGGATQDSGWLVSGTNCVMAHTFATHGTYHVKAKVIDTLGAVSSYSSTLTVVIDAVPSVPSTPVGTSLGKPAIEYTYTTSATDPESVALTYTFNWGDGSAQTTVGPFASGATTDPVPHTFATFGVFLVKAYATNAVASSGWSSTLTVTIAGGKSYAKLVGI